MCFIRRWICKIFKLDEIMTEYEKYAKEYEALKNDYEIRQPIPNLLIEWYKKELAESKKEITELKEIYANPISYVENALKESREAYEKCVADMEELLAKQDRLEHKAYARGRSDAYAEMGIKALDARLNGETLYVDENDNIIEEMDGETFKAFCEDNEIDISDLVGRMENEGVDRE